MNKKGFRLWFEFCLLGQFFEGRRIDVDAVSLALA